MSRLFHQIPDPLEGEDHSTYFKRLREELKEMTLPQMELMEACRLKINRRAAEKLLTRIVEGEDILALREATVLLLKEHFKL